MPVFSSGQSARHSSPAPIRALGIDRPDLSPAAAASWRIRAASRRACARCGRHGTRPSPEFRSMSMRASTGTAAGAGEVRGMTEPLFSFYGDDFTGSTDALEALAANGVPSVLFLAAPRRATAATFPDCRAIGIAGESRSRVRQWMSANLPGIFASLKAYGAPICQYKVCSTFDSSERMGSIGRALEIGLEVFETAWAPIAVAAPHLETLRGIRQSFRRGCGRDLSHRSPSHHAAPSGDADGRKRPAAAPAAADRSSDRAARYSGDAFQRIRKLPSTRLAGRPGAVLFDGVDEGSLEVTGRLLWSDATGGTDVCGGQFGPDARADPVLAQGRDHRGELCRAPRRRG